MKKISLICFASLLSVGISFGQTKSILNLTQQYLQIKNALSNDDAQKAKIAATDFNKSVSNISMNDITATLHPTFMENQKTLIKDSKIIASNTDLKGQRAAFAELSKSMIALAKKDKISDHTIYIDYCPMKKTSWLSDQKEISNPFYGTSMIDCGKLTATY